MITSNENTNPIFNNSNDTFIEPTGAKKNSAIDNQLTDPNYISNDVQTN